MSITAANSEFFLSIDGLFSAPQRLQGYAADEVFDTDTLATTETSMGVDGKLSGGFVFVPVRQGITLQADSISQGIFDQWYGAQQAGQDAFTAQGLVLLPSLGRKWTMTKGFLSEYKPLPDARRILQPRKFAITWERVSPAAAA